MTWMTLIWLLIGFGLGLGSGWLLWQSSRRLSILAAAQSAVGSQEAIWQDPLQQTELAYQMASEMSQFKAGFLARISHELRSPLNGMIGMHQLILSDLCDGPEEEREFIAQANESALKMVKILDDILDVAKAEHGTSKLDIQPLQLAQVFQEVATLTYLQAKNRNLWLQIQPPDPDLYVLADPRRLRQVLVNLVDTAIAQMQEGSIRVSAHPAIATGQVHIWVDDQRSPEVWREAVNLLQSSCPPSMVVPSPGLNLLMNQTLLQLMQGRLELLAITDEPPLPAANELATAYRNRVQCSVPMLVPELE